MASEYASVKTEPPWLPILPPMARISTTSSSSSRARLSHRRPIIILPPPSVDPSPRRTAAADAPQPVSEGPCLATPLAAPSRPAAAAEMAWPVSSSSSGLEGADRAVSRLVNLLCNIDSPGLASIEKSSASELLPHYSEAECSIPTNGSHFSSSSLLVSTSVKIRPASQQLTASCEDDGGEAQKDGGMGFVMEIAACGVNEGKDPDSMDVAVAEIASPASYPNASEARDECRGAEVRVDDEEMDLDVGFGAEIAYFVKDEETVADDVEMEEGQLPGEWSGAEEPVAGSETAQTLEEATAMSPPVREVPTIAQSVNVTDHIYYAFRVQGALPEQRNGGNVGATGKRKKKKKHKKGEGAKKKSREKAKEKYNVILTKRRAEALSSNGKDCSAPGEKARDINDTSKLKKEPEAKTQTSPKKVVDEGPEDGEISLQSSKTDGGILSSLVEDEVGLWTTDNVDDQFVTEMEKEGAVKRKRGPETAERKLKRKIAKRRKRAQKERELGIRRPPRTAQSKPVKVLCTHYMKGRCAKGDQCTFSHDAVPLTKLEPCKFFMSHSCLKGEDCPYSHDLRTFPCKFFHTRGLCYDGAKCQFSHGAISDEALEKLKKRVEKEKKERISSTSAYDIPMPSFSTPLPLELDPDPLGWGVTTSYHSQEEPVKDTKTTIVDKATQFYGDFHFKNRAHVPPALGMSGQPAVFSASKDRKDSDAGSPPQIDKKAKEANQHKQSYTEALKVRKPVVLRSLRTEGQPSVPVGLPSRHHLHTASKPRIVNSPVCPSPPNERNNAREVLEVSQMEGKIDAEQSPREVLTTNVNDSCTHSVLSVPNFLVSKRPGRMVLPMLRGRQLGRLVTDNGTNIQSPEPRKQHTVESLLDEALRQ